MDIANIIFSLPPFFRRHKLIRLLITLFPKSVVQLIEFNDTGKLYADLSHASARDYMIKRRFEPEFFSIAVPFLLSGGTFFDVGANFGFCSFGLIAALPEQNIQFHLFEANENIIHLLRRSATIHKKHIVKINNCCVSDRDGDSRLNIVWGNVGQSFVSPNGSEKVANLILDEYIENNGITEISFMKMDIEGHEPLALAGTTRSLNAGKIKILYIEVSEANLARGGFVPGDIFDLLENAGFKLFYCKSIDFISGIAQKNDTLMMQINGQSLKICPITKFPYGHQTDILAIHHSFKSF